MENKYLNYKKSLKKVSNIKVFDEKTGKKRNLKSKEDYRVFFNSKSRINIKLKEGLPRFPDKYYEKTEDINFNWFDWLNLEKNNYYHFKGKFKKHTVGFCLFGFETKTTKSNVFLNSNKNYKIQQVFFESKKTKSKCLQEVGGSRPSFKRDYYGPAQHPPLCRNNGAWRQAAGGGATAAVFAPSS